MNPDEPLGHVVSSIPQPQQADPGFQASGSLQIPNAIKPANGMSDSSFLNTLLPYASTSSPIMQAQQQMAKQEQPL